VFALFGIKDYDTAIRIMSEELLNCTKSQPAVQQLASIIENYATEENNLERYCLEGELKKNERIRLKQFDLKVKHFRVVIS
jgi:hypothetical protein